MKILLVVALAFVGSGLWQIASADDQCWTGHGAVEGESVDRRAIRWGWYSFVHSCEEGVDAGARRLNEVETAAFVEMVYSSIGANWRPILEWDSMLPEETVGLHSSSGHITFRNPDTTIHTILHEIAHDLMWRLEGGRWHWLYYPHGRLYRNVSLWLHQRFAWEAEDSLRLTTHACAAAEELGLTLLAKIGPDRWWECGLR